MIPLRELHLNDFEPSSESSHSFNQRIYNLNYDGLLGISMNYSPLMIEGYRFGIEPRKEEISAVDFVDKFRKYLKIENNYAILHNDQAGIGIAVDLYLGQLINIGDSFSLIQENRKKLHDVFSQMEIPDLENRLRIHNLKELKRLQILTPVKKKLI